MLTGGTLNSSVYWSDQIGESNCCTSRPPKRNPIMASQAPTDKIFTYGLCTFEERCHFGQGKEALHKPWVWNISIFSRCF